MTTFTWYRRSKNRQNGDMPQAVVGPSRAACASSCFGCPRFPKKETKRVLPMAMPRFGLHHKYNLMASCENLAEVKRALDRGWSVALTVPEDYPKSPRVKEILPGVKAVYCPAKLGLMTCNECRLCDPLINKQRFVVLFAEHGTVKDGCYAWNGTPLIGAISHWKSIDEVPVTIERALAERAPTAKAVRLGAIGDPRFVPAREHAKVRKLATAAGLAVIGYTHFWGGDPA